MLCLLSKFHLPMVEEESSKVCNQDENTSDSRQASNNKKSANVSTETECSTPKRNVTSLKRTPSESSVTIVDLVKSPKRRKQSVGSTPFSRK